MFLRSDLAKVFRATNFVSEADAQAFVSQATASGANATDVAKLLPVLLELGARAGAQAHAIRSDVFAAVVRAVPGPELFLPCVRAMKVADARLLSILTALLPIVNDVGAHGELCALLDSPEAPVRAAAAEVLRQIGGKSALEILSKRALDPAFLGRVEAMNALVSRAGQHALPLLAASISAGKPREKIHALRLLADRTKFRDVDAAAEAAVVGLDDKDDLVLAQAITTLGQLEVIRYWDRVEAKVEGRGQEVLRAFLAQAARNPSDATAAVVRERFRLGPKPIRLMLIEVIEQAGAEAFLPTLVEALSHRDVGTRTRAAHAISELARTSRLNVARAIVFLLKSRDVNVRRLAAEIANRVEDPGEMLAPKLLQFLRDEDWWVRERVLDALVEMNTPAITKHIIKEYLGDTSAVVRRFAVSALMRIKDSRAIGALVRAAQEDEDWLVADLAVEAVGSLGDPRAVAYLIDLMQKRPELRLSSVAALVHLRATEALPDIAELAQDESADVRAAAIHALDQLDDGTYALWVKGCEEDPAVEVREAARRLLKRYRLVKSSAASSATQTQSIDAILQIAVQESADDLFLSPGHPPYVKRHGQMYPVEAPALSEAQIRNLVRPHLSHDQADALEEKREVDFSYQLPSADLRFRVNVFHQRVGISAVFRTVANKVPSLEMLGMPEVIRSFAEFPNGLVLVGGPTGAGKSTTLAALIDHINRTRPVHIVTIEDPVEVIHVRQKALVNQRELGPHTRSFGGALRSALRQDPDVILVGELRDLETISFAVTAAETGHLVLGTVHTTSADATVDRLINAFPPRQQNQIRSMLAESLRAVTCQHLLRTIDGKRVPAVEVMIANDAVQSLIRKGKSFQIPTIIATSRDQGMQLLDADLIRLAKSGTVVVEDAYAKANDKAAFEAALGLPSSQGADNGAGRESIRRPSQHPGASVAPAGASPGAPANPSMPPAAARFAPPPSRAPRG